MLSKDKKLARLATPDFRLAFLLMLVFAAAGCFFNLYLGLAQFAAAGGLFIFLRQENLRRRRELLRFMDSVRLRVGDSAEPAAAELPLPMAVVRLSTGEIVWCNRRFDSLVRWRERWLPVGMGEILPGFELKWLSDGGEEYGTPVTAGGRSYRVLGSVVRPESGGHGELGLLFFLDVTELEALRHDLPLARPVVSILQIDNFDEFMKNVPSYDRALLLANIDARVGEWADGAGGVLVKSERDRYTFVFEERHLESFVKSKFEVLDIVRRIQNPDGIPATLSVGFGKGGETYSDSLQSARLALDMALSRGGDQAVVKSPRGYEFFGGRSGEVEKRTKVRSRVMANAISEMITSSSQVIAMGHKFSDMDSIGAATGIVCACRRLQKQAKIVIDLSGTSARVLYDKLRQVPEYASVFISPEEAVAAADRSTLLVVVDTNRPEYVDTPEVLERVGRVVVIDHHRRAADYIDNAALNLHEPYASSACELVTEVLQYIVTPQDILRAEAECLMAGITLDTKNFTMKTGVRTFEAAAFLRRCGADTIEVKRLFQNDMESYFSRCDVIRTAIKYRDCIAIAHSADNVERPVAAQAADELLGIAGIQASFVIYRNRDTTHVSGRSLGQINVQVILERLGGGGSLTNAGVQMGDMPIDEVAEKLKKAIDAYYNAP